ncbi:hypothetical protein GVO02_18440 [Aeromonas caviae]|uniref:Uncharacterized protein n=3 Tax=Aeromonas caviae TaxID=648 RepID=A0AAF0JZ11_AERCA|nr:MULTISPECIES: hypothetical protein [Aeromonas]MDU7311929.1 hypothetical protein [Aeromonas sp.]MBL0538618.1 hypothetical protein [Aeromonas caviae]MBL0559103.1 hypothetical protein [Aeromonas caviae]MCK2071588.1 hypothetical protein [Aeromonas caviae]MCU7794077.1 hypothetical protein [Aeromonas caviae]
MKRYKRLEIPNIVVLDAAEQFYQSAKILKDMPPGSGVLLPMLTNAALAMELYIKSLNTLSVIENYETYSDGSRGGEVTEKAKTCEHDLSIILANVDDAVKINIGNMFDNGSINHSFGELIELVRPYDKLFVRSRYSYEKLGLPAVSISDLFYCIEFIRDLVDKVSPSTGEGKQ